MSTIITDNNNTTQPDRPNRGTVNSRLQFLEDLEDYQVHHDDIDPRGYTVKSASGDTIGEVEGLLADVAAKRVRYVEVEIEDDVITRHTGDRYTEADRHALIPAGLVDIDTDNNSVTLLGLSLDQLVDYPRFERQHGYTTGYEIDANDYLSDFHEYGSKYDRKRYSTDAYRSGSTLEDGFYNTGLYSEQYR